MKLTNSYINRIKKTYNFNDDKKIKEINTLIQYILEKYDLSCPKILKELNYNILLEANSKKYGNVIIKILMDENYNYHEMEMLKLYNGNYACKLLEEDYINNIYILERIIPGNKLADIQDIKKRTNIVCDLINKIIIPYQDNKKTKIPLYSDQLDEIYEYIKKNEVNEKVKCHLKRCQDLHKEIKDLHLPLYFLHNDLHSYNILKSDNDYVAIDPHGVIGEKIFEYAPYIINELWNSKYDEKFFYDFYNYIEKISKISKILLLKVSYIHLFLSTIWFIQDNCSKRLLEKNVKILNFLKKAILE